MKHKSFEQDVVRRKNKIFARLLVILLILLLSASLCFAVKKVYEHNNSTNPGIKRLFKLWNNKDYLGVYEVSSHLLEDNPLNNRALIFKGYSSFFLALSQTDMSSTQNYLDEAILNLRIARLVSGKRHLAQIYYMLAKSYFHKNIVSDYYYYSDLAVKYFKLAKENGYNAPDIPEYLGLSYAELGQSEESIVAFTEALIDNESDKLLLAIAQQYYNCKKSNTAKQYLNKINEESANELLVLKSRLLLAQIYIDEEKYDEALKEYESIIEKDANSADAYYGIGVIYEKQGDLVKARAEWRKALKVQVNHPASLKKMGK